jgi:hypothetical protein
MPWLVYLIHGPLKHKSGHKLASWSTVLIECNGSSYSQDISSMSMRPKFQYSAGSNSATCRNSHPDEYILHHCFLFVSGATGSQWAVASSFTRFLDHKQWRTIVGRTPLEEWTARRRDLYLITHNTHNRPTSMPPVGFETINSAGERPQTYALDRAAVGIGCTPLYPLSNPNIFL